MNMLSLVLFDHLSSRKNRRVARLGFEQLEDRLALSAMGMAIPDAPLPAMRLETAETSTSMESKRPAAAPKLSPEAVDEVMSLQGFLIDARV
jgi:hypothetical protein